MELAILFILALSAIAGLGCVISAVVVRGRLPVAERRGIASGRLATGIVLLALPVGLVLLGLLFAVTLGRLGTV